MAALCWACKQLYLNGQLLRELELRIEFLEVKIK